MSLQRLLVLPALMTLTLAHAALLPTSLSVTSAGHQATSDAYIHQDRTRRSQQTVLGGVDAGPLSSVYAYCHQNAPALLPSPDLSAHSTHTLTFTLPTTAQSSRWRADLDLHDAQGRTVLLEAASTSLQDGALTFVFTLPINRGRGIERARLR